MESSLGLFEASFCNLLLTMGLLDKLWDDVVAGPQPEKGLKKLREERLDAGLPVVFPVDNHEFAQRMIERQRSAEFHNSQAEARRISESIRIKNPPMLRPLDNDSPMSSPGIYGSSPPVSPPLSSPSPVFREKDKRWRSVFHPDGREMSRNRSAEFEQVAAPNSPTVYDWMVISALDR